MTNHLRDAIRIAGGPAKLAKALGLTRSAVHQWEEAPPKHCVKIEKLTGVSRHKLRPDVFGKEPPREDKLPIRPKTSVQRSHLAA